ncbi:MAG TPA: SufS family cysteine desulfurase [Acidimicrobiales bacterium]|nr:SufS family cysteine desulfurase [Acidimicrobiales bacterium]
MAGVDAVTGTGGRGGAGAGRGAPHLDVAAVRADFPILDVKVNGHRLVYLDSASSSQKPRQVIDTMSRYYETTHANVHRGVYTIAEEATRLYEDARARLARLLNAGAAREIVFTKNVTEGINLVAQSWGRANLRAGDAVLLTHMEHHANLVPWLILKDQLGIELRYLPLTDDGLLDLSDLERLVDGVKLVGVTAMSNVLGTITPVREIADAAHAAGALCLVDAAQLVPHVATDVQALGCDFLGVTGHKMLGPTGIGAIWAREELLEAMPPFLGGGEMISDVRLDGFSPNEVPWKFEAGTMPIAEAVGLGAAIEYLDGLGMDAVRRHEIDLTSYALCSLRERHGDDLRIFGPAEATARGGVLSLALGDIHPHDLSQVLDQYGVCVRAGHHCAKPLMRCLGVSATARASLYVYNDRDDVDELSEALAEARKFFA